MFENIQQTNFYKYQPFESDYTDQRHLLLFDRLPWLLKALDNNLITLAFFIKKRERYNNL